MTKEDTTSMQSAAPFFISLPTLFFSLVNQLTVGSYASLFWGCRRRTTLFYKMFPDTNCIWNKPDLQDSRPSCLKKMGKRIVMYVRECFNLFRQRPYRSMIKRKAVELVLSTGTDFLFEVLSNLIYLRTTNITCHISGW